LEEYKGSEFGVARMTRMEDREDNTRRKESVEEEGSILILGNDCTEEKTCRN
jgi:hypothetical protein